MSQILSLSSDPCLPYLQVIEESECLGESLVKINLNFQNLETITCNLKQKIESMKTVRTFFYYGVNSETNLQGGRISRPSNATIYNFLNNSNQLNLPSISYPNDIAYVIYQKTGYLPTVTQRTTPILNGTTTDFNSNLAPVFVLWKYTYNFDAGAYLIDNNFPKFIRNLTTDGISLNWSDPSTWTTFDSWN
jgi:hypothetical protein